MSPQNDLFLSVLACKYLNEHINTHLYLYNTYKSYAIDLNQFLRPLKNNQIQWDNLKKRFITPQEERMKKLQTQVPEGVLLTLIRKALHKWSSLLPATRNRKLSTIRSFLKWLHLKEFITKDLRHHLPSSPVPRQIPHFLSVDEVMSVIKTLQEQQDQTTLSLILLLYGGGLRVSEACHAKWKDIQWTTQTIRIFGKGQKERLVSLPSFVLQELKKLPQKGGFIFGTRPLNPRTAYNYVRKAGAKANLLKPLHPHALRHSYATHLLSSGADLRILQSLLGHQSLKATEKYLHMDMARLSQVVEHFHPLSKKKVSGDPND